MVFVLIVTPNFESLDPFFVVIRITPLPALEPYKAAELGPLSTDIDSISLGLISEIPPPVSYTHLTLPTKA